MDMEAVHNLYNYICLARIFMPEPLAGAAPIFLNIQQRESISMKELILPG